MELTELLLARDAAVAAVERAADVIRSMLDSGDWSVSSKPDESPVTEVDIAAEHAIRTILAEVFPGAGFFGEETGRTDPQSGAGQSVLRWLVDPIDGTKSFVRGLPFYSTQIALEVDGELVVGVSNAPAFGERLIAVAGHGVTLERRRHGSEPGRGGSPVRVSDVDRIDDAFLSSGNLTTLARDATRWRRYGELVSRVRRVRGYGDFCHYHQLCSGGADIVVESDLNILDIAALVVGLREAGATVTDLDGAPINEHTTSLLAAADAGLHAEVLSLLSGG